MAIPEHIPVELRVVAWDDPVVETHGFAPTSVYIEWCWLPVLGPTATWLYRRLGTLAATGTPTGVDLVDLSVSFGLGEGIGRNSIMVRTLARLDVFGVARWLESGYAVRTALPALPERHLRRLSYSARVIHERITGAR